MKKIGKLLSFGAIALVALSLGSCQCDCSGAASAVNLKNKDISESTRGTEAKEVQFKKMLAKSLKSEIGAMPSVERFKYNAKMLGGQSIKSLQVLGSVDTDVSASEDAAFVKSIFNSLMVADNVSQQLEVEFTMSDEPVDNGVFLFSIKTADPKTLTFQMYDEEGFDLVAYNKFSINGGNNYKALNVQSFESGTYLLKLSDATGKEMVRKVQIQDKK